MQNIKCNKVYTNFYSVFLTCFLIKHHTFLSCNMITRIFYIIYFILFFQYLILFLINCSFPIIITNIFTTIFILFYDILRYYDVLLK
jgi:hypothetical protein